MEVATAAAKAAVVRFAVDEEEAEMLTLFLSEAPIGDEYGTLTKKEWDRGNEFLAWLAEHDVPAFEEQRL